MSGASISIVNAKYMGDYQIEFVFNDGRKRVVDFKPFLDSSRHSEIKKYLDKALFQKFTLEYGEIYWNDYDLVFPIIDLYQDNLLHKKSGLEASQVGFTACSASLGCCGCFVVSEEHKTMELGYIIDKPYWGQGMVVEAARAVVDFVFSNYPVERLQCRCKVENIASQRVMAKLGFRPEGVLRSALWHRERFWDMYTTSMLRSEWRAKRDDQ